MVQGSCDVIHLTSSILLLSCLISSDFLAPPWARKFFLVGARISSLKLTMQRYDAAIAVHESCRKKNRFFFKSGHECHVSRVSLSALRLNLLTFGHSSKLDGSHLIATLSNSECKVRIIIYKL